LSPKTKRKKYLGCLIAFRIFLRVTKVVFLRQKEFENSGAYVRPQSFVIKESRTEKNVNGHPVIEPITLTGQFVPFRHVLKGFLELLSVLTDVLEYVEKLEKSFHETGYMENIIQGELWRNKIKPRFPGKQMLPLRFSFDDYETNKELGAHTGVHKLGAGYVKIGCLPPKFASTLENMFLAVLFHFSDRTCGNRAVFRKVIEEIKFREDTGISVCTSEGLSQIYFTLALVEGFNLGSNSILE